MVELLSWTEQKKRLFSQESSKFFSSLKVEMDNGIYKGSGTYTLPNQLSNTANEIEFKSDSNVSKVPLPYGAVTLCRSVTTTRTSVDESVSQIILTFHNRDFIEATLSAMEQLGRLKDLSYQRLGFYKGQRKAFLFSGDSLFSAFESNMEMR